MNIKHLSTPLSVIQVAAFDPAWLTIKPLFLAQTPEECSIVLPTAAVPNETLAAHQISIFAVSTYNTDYLLIKEQQIEQAKDILQAHAYTIVADTSA